MLETLETLLGRIVAPRVTFHFRLFHQLIQPNSHSRLSLSVSVFLSLFHSLLLSHLRLLFFSLFSSSFHTIFPPLSLFLKMLEFISSSLFSHFQRFLSSPPLFTFFFLSSSSRRIGTFSDSSSFSVNPFYYFLESLNCRYHETGAYSQLLSSSCFVITPSTRDDRKIILRRPFSLSFFFCIYISEDFR